jgi:S1-C subfamily serine protease
MKFKTITKLSLLLALFVSCSQPRQQISQNVTDYEKQRLVIFEEIERSVLRISCSAYYDNYYYNKPKEKSTSHNLEELLIKKEATTNSVAGSGIIITQNPRKNLLLTCYHLFDFQDTLKTYYSSKRGIPTKDLLSLSIKKGQMIYVSHKNGSRTVGTIIAFDKKNDIALIETDTQENLLIENPFRGSFGKKQDLKFGRQSYLLGFPKGFLSISQGLISPSPYKNRFMIDAPFNRGFSGGAVIVVNEREKTYTYLGMANSMAYDSQLVTVPSENKVNIKFHENMPYTDEIYVKELKLVNVGLTFAVNCQVITKFLASEKERLRLKGHYLPEEIK